MRGHDAIWTYLPPGPFSDPAEFDAYIAECEQNKERIFYAAVDSSGRAVGILSLMEIRPADGLVLVWLVQHGGHPGEGGKAVGVFRDWARNRFAR